MFTEFNLYAYGPLLLDDEQLQSINIQRVDKVGFTVLVSEYSKVLCLKMDKKLEYGKIVKNSDLFNDLTGLSSSDCNYYCSISNDVLYTYKLKKYYGISFDGDPIVLYNNEEYRNQQLHQVRLYGINDIIWDMQNTNSLIQDYLTQKQEEQCSCLIKRHIGK